MKGCDKIFRHFVSSARVRNVVLLTTPHQKNKPKVNKFGGFRNAEKGRYLTVQNHKGKGSLSKLFLMGTTVGGYKYGLL